MSRRGCEKMKPGEEEAQGNEDEEILCHTHFLREEIFFLFDSPSPRAPPPSPPHSFSSPSLRVQ